MLKKFDCLKFAADNFSNSKDEVIEEAPLSIFVNGRYFVTAMISPQMVKEFVVGHLFSEKIIKGIKEIESLQIEGNIAKVIMPNSPLRLSAAKRLVVSGCGGTSSFLDGSQYPKVRSDLKTSAENIFRSVKEILTSNLHRVTGGVHSVGLFDSNGTICISEDVGRHNALDKVIGYRLNIGFEDTFVTCTGRISSEMVLKCAVANIALIISTGATTSLAIEIAENTGLTIIGFVRGNRMNVYTGWERICRTDTQGR